EHAGRQRVLRVRDPFGELEPAARRAGRTVPSLVRLGWWEIPGRPPADRRLVLPGENSREDGRGLFAGGSVVAANLDEEIPRQTVAFHLRVARPVLDRQDHVRDRGGLLNRVQLAVDLRQAGDVGWVEELRVGRQRRPQGERPGRVSQQLLPRVRRRQHHGIAGGEFAERCEGRAIEQSAPCLPVGPPEHWSRRGLEPGIGQVANGQPRAEQRVIRFDPPQVVSPAVDELQDQLALLRYFGRRAGARAATGLRDYRLG